MPQLNQGQTGTLRSTPKLTRINGDDALALIYRNMGNNHAYPFVWSETITLTSGTNAAVITASGTKFHGMEAATYCNIVATPLENPGSITYWIDKNTTINETRILLSTAVAGDTPFDVMVMVGVDPNIESIACRGNRGASQSLP